MESKYEHFWYEGFDGSKLYARIYPNNTSEMTVLCLHGLTRSSLDFEGVADKLSGHFTLVVPDQRGRGQSSWAAPDTYTPVAYMRDMFKLLESLGKKKVIVIGTSMGGIIAMLMNATKPSVIQGVVLNDVGPEVTQEGADKIKSYIGKNRVFASWSAAEEFCQSQYGSGFPEYTNEDWVVFARRLYTEKSSDEITLNYDPAIDDVVKNTPSSTVPPDLWSLFHTLDSKPLLVIRGENSDILSAQCMNRMLSNRSNGITAGIDVRNRAHAPMLDEPECVAVISKFLYEVSENRVHKKKVECERV